MAFMVVMRLFMPQKDLEMMFGKSGLPISFQTVVIGRATGALFLLLSGWLSYLANYAGNDEIRRATIIGHIACAFNAVMMVLNSGDLGLTTPYVSIALAAYFGVTALVFAMPSEPSVKMPSMAAEAIDKTKGAIDSTTTAFKKAGESVKTSIDEAIDASASSSHWFSRNNVLTTDATIFSVFGVTQLILPQLSMEWVFHTKAEVAKDIRLVATARMLGALAVMAAGYAIYLARQPLGAHVRLATMAGHLAIAGVAIEALWNHAQLGLSLVIPAIFAAYFGLTALRFCLYCGPITDKLLAGQNPMASRKVQ
jgi:hypothetical protein